VGPVEVRTGRRGRIPPAQGRLFVVWHFHQFAVSVFGSSSPSPTTLLCKGTGFAVFSIPSISAEEFLERVRPVTVPRLFSSNQGQDGRPPRPGIRRITVKRSVNAVTVVSIPHFRPLMCRTRRFYPVSQRPSACSACKFLAPVAMPICSLGRGL
jgi:hypothetical protein